MSKNFKFLVSGTLYCALIVPQISIRFCAIKIGLCPLVAHILSESRNIEHKQIFSGDTCPLILNIGRLIIMVTTEKIK